MVSSEPRDAVDELIREAERARDRAGEWRDEAELQMSMQCDPKNNGIVCAAMTNVARRLEEAELSAAKYLDDLAEKFNR
jgi:hypothetical protein